MRRMADKPLCLATPKEVRHALGYVLRFGAPAGRTATPAAT